jgi:hypothetical protein
MRTTLAMVAAACLALVAACSDHIAPPAPIGPEFGGFAIEPGPGSTAPPTAAVVVTFGEPMDTSTLTPDGLRVEDGSGDLPGSYAYAPSSRRWTFRPAVELSRGMTVRVVLTTSVRSASGLQLASDRVVEFAVADGTLQMPFDLGVGETQVPRFAAMQDGIGLLGHGGLVYELTGASLATVAMPAQVAGLCVARTGDAAVLCADAGSGTFRLSMVRRSAGTWGAAATVVEQPCFLTTAELLGNSRGDLAVYWNGLLGLPEQNFEGMLRSVATAPERFDPVAFGFVMLYRWVALDGAGQVFYVTLDTNGVRVVRVGLDGGLLDLPVTPPGSNLQDLRAYGTGRLLALYSTGNALDGDLRSRRFDPEHGLEPEQVRLHEVPHVAAFELGERGDGVVVLLPDAAGQLRAMTVLGSSGGWTAPQSVLSGATGFVEGGIVAVAVSPRGVVFLACARPDGDGQELVLLRAPPGGAFGPPLHVDSVPAGMQFVRPAIAADESGRAVLLWQTRTVAYALTGALLAARFE